MTYTAGKPRLVPSPDQLRARIPGWGADLDPRDRPSVPRLQFDPGRTGAHWSMPERQEERWPRERSIEHGEMPAVFGTSCPPKGLSGMIRRYSYRRFSEARAAHWLLLMAADRVDATGSHVRRLATLRPDPIASGIRSALSGRGIGSPFAHRRSYLKHQWLDPFVVAAPWIIVAGLCGLIGQRLRHR